MDILEIAERHKLPIIADEVYEFFTFPGIEFFPLSTLSTTVPILCKQNDIFLIVRSKIKVMTIFSMFWSDKEIYNAGIKNGLDCHTR